MMKRINEAQELDTEGKDKQKSAANLHDHTYGITSDPLTQSTCVFSAIIHDADHPGVPNPQLVKENPVLALKYQGRSVAEQNSFDLTWDVYMQPHLQQLRDALCPTKSELRRFRQLVINSVMATDLGDKELKALREGRRKKAFNVDLEERTVNKVNRKATIVIEHLIQAADGSHTMQHWHVYIEWNQKLFREINYAYKAGRADKNPADYWYEGELGFFDFYIIPLSKKLANCGVFGPTSDKNLNYANRIGPSGCPRVRELLRKLWKSWLRRNKSYRPPVVRHLMCK